MNIQGIKNWSDWIHPLATVMGAWGGFPKPPKIFLKLTQYELFKWFLVFTLAYQGGAREDIKQALIITVVFFLIAKILDFQDVIATDIEHESASSIASPHPPTQSTQLQDKPTLVQQTTPNNTEQFVNGNFSGYYL